MPDPTKKTMVKVPKRLLSEDEIANAGGNKKLSKKNIEDINKISALNMKSVASEAMAKRDSTSASKNFLLKTPLKVSDSQYTEEADAEINRKIRNGAAKAGSKAANTTRNKEGGTVGQVGTYDNATGTKEAFSVRNKPVEKDYKRV